MRLRSALVPLVLVAGGGLLAVPPAAGDPDNSKNVFSSTLTCDDGNSYEIVVAGGHNADRDIFTPAHDLAGTGNFVPVVFEDFEGTIYDAGGTELFSFTDEFVADRGNGEVPKGRTPISCVFSVTDTFVAGPEDAQFGLTPGQTYTVVGHGGVEGFATGKR